MSHSRNHLNPAFIIKRFEPTRLVVTSNFPDTEINYDGKGRKTVIRLNKAVLFNNNYVNINDHTYTHTKSNYFIKNELYFLDNVFLNDLYTRSTNPESKEYISRLTPTSLEISFNKYEILMSSLLDRLLEKNFQEISNDDKKIILKFLDSSHLRPLKYKNIEFFLKAPERDPFKDLISYTHNVQHIIENPKESKLFEGKTFEEMTIMITIIIDFCKKIVPPDLFSIIETTLKQIPLMFHNMKNNEPVEALDDYQLIYIESKSIEFLLSDNTVYTIYKSDNPSIIDKVNKYLKERAAIENDLIKISIMVLSPNNIIMQVSNSLGDKHIIANDDLVKLVNSITLFASDEWIVSKNIIKDITEIIDVDNLLRIKDYHFFEKDIAKLLVDLNYDIGITNEFDKFNDSHLNDFITVVHDFILKNGNKIESYIISKNCIDLNFIIEANHKLLWYFTLKINKLFNDIIGLQNGKIIKVFIGKLDNPDADIPNYTESIYYDINNLNKNLKYDFLLLQLT